MRRLTPARWGFIPSRRREGEKGPAPINARSESAAASRLFAPGLKTRRCVIPASGFYEWQAVEGQKRKQPHHIEPTDAPAFALAGLWSRWQPQDGEPVETFTILTGPANETLKAIHNRMPVILPFSALHAWLDPALNDAKQASTLLRPAPDEAITAHPVSTWVNNPAHDDLACLRKPIQSL